MYVTGGKNEKGFTDLIDFMRYSCPFGNMARGAFAVWSRLFCELGAVFHDKERNGFRNARKHHRHRFHGYRHRRYVLLRTFQKGRQECVYMGHRYDRFISAFTYNEHCRRKLQLRRYPSAYPCRSLYIQYNKACIIHIVDKSVRLQSERVLFTSPPTKYQYSI